MPRRISQRFRFTLRDRFDADYSWAQHWSAGVFFWRWEGFMMGGRPTNSFSHVAALEPHGADAAKKLGELHAELHRLHATNDARRLSEADAAAARRDFTALRRFVVSGVPLDELAELLHGQVRRLIGWRNAIALFPLLLTWAALAWASWDYHQQVQQEPESVTRPFLDLWQQRFGHMFIPTFAETATGSFLLLITVLLLTALAHRKESDVNDTLAAVYAMADDALNALGLAVEKSNVRPPDNAKEWATAASRVLTETQQMIKSAVRDTAELAKNNEVLSRSVVTEFERLQRQGKELLEGVGQETHHVMVALQRQSEQTTSRVGKEATQILRHTAKANRQLIEQEMTPLFEGFKTSLAEYRQDQETYRAGASRLTGGITDLTTAAAGLSGGVGAYTAIAQSMDEKLQVIGDSQAEFVQRIDDHSARIGSAATMLHDLAALMTGSMKRDVEEMSQNVIKASKSLAVIERGLSGTSESLEVTTRNMAATAASLQQAAESVAKAAVAIGGASGAGPGGSRGPLARLFKRGR
jgi:hypothetical protein